MAPTLRARKPAPVVVPVVKPKKQPIPRPKKQSVNVHVPLDESESNEPEKTKKLPSKRRPRKQAVANESMEEETEANEPERTKKKRLPPPPKPRSRKQAAVTNVPMEDEEEEEGNEHEPERRKKSPKRRPRKQAMSNVSMEEEEEEEGNEPERRKKLPPKRRPRKQAAVTNVPVPIEDEEEEEDNEPERRKKLSPKRRPRKQAVSNLSMEEEEAEGSESERTKKLPQKRRPRKPSVSNAPLDDPETNDEPKKKRPRKPSSIRLPRKPVGSSVPVEEPRISAAATGSGQPKRQRAKGNRASAATKIRVQVVPKKSTLEKVQYLLEGTCQLFRVGNLYNLIDDSEIAMARFRRKLIKRIKEHIGNDNDKYDFDAEFSLITDLPKNPWEYHSIFIEVTRVRRDNPRKAKPKAVFIGMFTSCGAVTHHYNHPDSEDGIRFLPIFIANSRAKYMRAVKLGLGAIFNCSFVSYALTWSDMAFIAGSWMLLRGSVDGDAMRIFCKDVQAAYESPQFHGEFEIYLDMNAWRQAWSVLTAERADSEEQPAIDEKDISRFWKTIMNITESRSVKLNKVHLTKISLPQMVLTSQGKIKAALEDQRSLINVLMNLTRSFYAYATTKDPEEE